MPADAGKDAMSVAGPRSMIQARVDSGAVLGIDTAVNRRREHDPALFLKPLEGISPHRIVGCDVRARDGDQASAFRKTGQHRADVSQCRIRHRAINMNRGREWRVHQDNARNDARIGVVVDVRGIKSRGGDGGKDLSENAGVALGDLIEDERGASQFCEDGQMAGAG